MPDRPTTSSDYTSEILCLVRQTLLQVVTTLGDLVANEKVIVVGGFVPSLLVSAASLPDGVEVHVGTLDLDMGLAIDLRDSVSYEELAGRLRRSGFE